MMFIFDASRFGGEVTIPPFGRQLSGRRHDTLTALQPFPFPRSFELSAGRINFAQPRSLRDYQGMIPDSNPFHARCFKSPVRWRHPYLK